MLGSVIIITAKNGAVRELSAAFCCASICHE
jgi:hypothetical protein